MQIHYLSIGLILGNDQIRILTNPTIILIKFQNLPLETLEHL